MQKRTVKKPKIVAVVGATATGKSGLAVELAKRFNGEIISADSRQVYRGLDIGTEKITKKERLGVPHHMLDVASPRRAYSVARFKRGADRAIRDILRRGKLPIIAGGTGFYIEAVVDNRLPPEVKPDPALRKELEKCPTEALWRRLNKLDPKRAKAIERGHKRRLIRAIEIASALGSVPPRAAAKPNYNVLQIGLALPRHALNERIEKRLMTAVRRGLLAETKRVREAGVSWKRMNELGLEYRVTGEYLRGEITRKEMIGKMIREVQNYARRQERWFARDNRIEWFAPYKTNKIAKCVTSFLEQ
jgi:tRNA dimethylallyltransferase